MNTTDFQTFVDSIGDGAGDACCEDPSYLDMGDWSVFQSNLTQALANIAKRGDDLPYNEVTNKCVHIARRVLEEIRTIRAKQGFLPWALGWISGDVPCDGNNCTDAEHAVLVAWCGGKPYLGGAQDGQVMSQDRVAQIKSVKYLYL